VRQIHLLAASLSLQSVAGAAVPDLVCQELRLIRSPRNYPKPHRTGWHTTSIWRASARLVSSLAMLGVNIARPLHRRKFKMQCVFLALFLVSWMGMA